MSRLAIIIPARYKSTRFPGKPLVPLLGKPMVLWVAELAVEAVGKDNVYVATDDKRISDVVINSGFKSIQTKHGALTGTDRVAEAALTVDADIYLNIQGDEPLITSKDIMLIAEAKRLNPDHVINGYCWMDRHEVPGNVNIPKVITTENDELVYISRVPLPGYKDHDNAPSEYKKQVCIYAFNRQELTMFRNFGRKSYLEACEDIEILRFIELGKKIKMVGVRPGSLAVDIPSDVPAVEERLRERLSI